MSVIQPSSVWQVGLMPERPMEGSRRMPSSLLDSHELISIVIRIKASRGELGSHARSSTSLHRQPPLIQAGTRFLHGAHFYPSGESAVIESP